MNVVVSASHAGFTPAAVHGSWATRWVAPRQVYRVSRSQPARCPLLVAGLGFAALSLAVGTVVGGFAGLTAGTLIFPVYGSILGLLAGLGVGLAVGAGYATLMLPILIVWHRDPAHGYEPLATIVRSVSILLTAVVVALTVAAGVLYRDMMADVAVGSIWIVLIWASTTAVTVFLVRPMVPAMCRAWTRGWGWS